MVVANSPARHCPTLGGICAGLGRGVNGAQRWLDFKIAIVQPSEFLKFALILYCAAWFSSRLREKESGLSFR